MAVFTAAITIPIATYTIIIVVAIGPVRFRYSTPRASPPLR